MTKNIQPGDTVLVNGDGDLAMDCDARKFIGGVAEVVKQCKSGLYQVRTDHGVVSLPKRNLAPVRMGSFSGLPSKGTPVTGPIQIYGDNWPHS